MGSHYLGRNESTTIPTYVGFLDTETNETASKHNDKLKLHTLRVGYATCFRWERDRKTRRQSLQFNSALAFKLWVISNLDPKRPLWMFAHNLGYDATVIEIWRWLEGGEFTVEEPAERFLKRSWKCATAKRQDGLLVTEGPPTIISLWHRSGSRIVLIDSMNYFPRSLSEIGDDVGIPKMDMPERTADDVQWMVYCRNDVAVLEEAVTKYMQFVRENDLGVFKMTAAAQSMASFKHRFCRHKILMSDNLDAKQFERRAYHGGECEAYFLGPVGNCNESYREYRWFREQDWLSKTNAVLYHLDCNSMYPSVMSDNVFPTKLLDVRPSVTVDELASCLNGYGVVAEVEIESKEEDFLCVKDGSILFVTGHFNTVLCSPELKRALACGVVKRVMRTQIYSVGSIFKDYVDCFWRLRQRYKEVGNKVFADLCKLLLCSLYGKWAQRAAGWIDIPECSSPVDWGYFHDVFGGEETVRTFRAIAGHVQMQVERGEMENTFPAISAFVTSYGREKMRHLRSLAGERNVYYQGVDSLVTNQVGFWNLSHEGCVYEEVLGMLRVKGVYSSGYFMGPNDYILDGLRTKAGLSAKAAVDDDGVLRQDEFTSPNSVLAAPNGPVQTVERRKFSEGKALLRRELRQDGWTNPLKIQMYSLQTPAPSAKIKVSDE